MRLTARVVTAVVVLASALLTFTATPAAAAPAAFANTVPTAVLTGVNLTFVTFDDNKDAESWSDITIFARTGAVAAQLNGRFPEFPEDSAAGPFAFTVKPGITAADLSTGLFRYEFIAYEHDTWIFGYGVTMYFSDGTKYVFRDDLKKFSNSGVFDRPFGVTSQVKVPNVLGDSQQDATAALAAVGLKVGKVTTKTDPNCGYVNTVMEQKPHAQQLADVGSAVDIAIGTKPKTPCN